MSILRYRYSEFEAAQKKLQDINADLDDIIDLTMKANETFVLVQMGEWAQAQADACIQVETDARIFREAMSSFEGKFSELVQAADSIKGERDAFVSSMGASASDGDLVACNTEGSVSSTCTLLVGQLSTLDAKAGDAQSALCGLRDSGAISAAIDMVKTDVSDEKEKVEDIRSAWSTLKSSATSFESTYSSMDEQSTSSLRSKFFITTEMLNDVGDTLVYNYTNGPVAQGLARMGVAREGLKDIKKMIETFAKPLAELDDLNQVSKFFGAMSTLIRSEGIGTFVKNLVSSNPFDNSVFLTRLVNQMSGGLLTVNVRPGNGYLKKLFTSETFTAPLDAWKNVRAGGAGVLDYFKSKFAKGGLASCADDAPKVTTITKALPRAGKFVKGACKGLGVVADVAELYGVFTNSKAAYQTTVGDDAQKTAAAVVAGGKGLLKFGVGKAVGAAVGTVIGGPVGTVIGMAVGGVIGDAIKGAIEDWDTSGLVDGLANFIRGDKKNAFAAG